MRSRRLYWIWKCPVPGCPCMGQKPTAHYLASRYAIMHGKRAHNMIIEPVFIKVKNDNSVQRTALYVHSKRIVLNERVNPKMPFENQEVELPC